MPIFKVVLEKIMHVKARRKSKREQNVVARVWQWSLLCPGYSYQHFGQVCSHKICVGLTLMQEPGLAFVQNVPIPIPKDRVSCKSPNISWCRKGRTESQSEGINSTQRSPQSSSYLHWLLQIYLKGYTILAFAGGAMHRIIHTSLR